MNQKTEWNKVFTQGWRKWYIPFLIGVVTMVVGFVIVAFLASQRIEQISGFNHPEGVVIAPDGNIYVTNLGQPGINEDGFISLVQDKEISIFAQGLNDPRGIIWAGEHFLVADVARIWKVSESGNIEAWVTSRDFPTPPKLLSDLAIDEDGNVYVSDRQSGIVFRISSNREVTTLDWTQSLLSASNGLLVVEEGGVLVADFSQGVVWRGTPGGESQLLAEDLGNPDGLAQDSEGNLYISDAQQGRIWKRSADGQQNVLLQGLKRPTDLALIDNRLLIVELDADRITFFNLD